MCSSVIRFNNIFFFIVVAALIQIEAGLLDSVPLIGNIENNARNHGIQNQPNQWTGNANNNVNVISNALPLVPLLTGITNRNNNQYARTNAGSFNNGQNGASRFNTGNPGRGSNWNPNGQINPTNNRPNNFNNLGQSATLVKEKEDLEKLLQRLKELNQLKNQQNNNGTSTNIYQSNFNNLGQRATLEKDKEELERLLERLKELNKLKDTQKNNGTNANMGNLNINNNITVPKGNDKNNDNTWKKTNTTFLFQMKPIRPEGETPNDTTESLYYLQSSS